MIKEKGILFPSKMVALFLDPLLQALGLGVYMSCDKSYLYKSD